MSEYKCFKCENNWSDINMVAYCAACYSKVRDHFVGLNKMVAEENAAANQLEIDRVFWMPQIEARDKEIAALRQELDTFKEYICGKHDGYAACPDCVTEYCKTESRLSQSRAECDRYRSALEKIRDAHYECLAPSVCSAEDVICIPCLTKQALRRPE